MTEIESDRRRGPSGHEAHAIPRPTAWPAAMGAGITLVAWGLIASLVLVVVGLVLFAVSLGGWIGEIRDERRES